MNKPPLAGFGLPYWLDLPRPRYPTLDRPATVDVAIIGSGIAGLKLARSLARHGLTSLICEGTRVGEGASGRNQGSANHEPSASYDEIIRHHSRAVARDLWQLGLENLRLIREQIAEYAIECDYFQGGMTSLVRRDLPGAEATEAGYRTDYLLTKEDGFDVDWLDEPAATAAGQGPAGTYVSGFRYNADLQFHSGKYVLGLAQGVSRLPQVRLCEGVRVHRISRSGSGVRLETSAHPVEAGAVFLATNALAPQFLPKYERALRAERGQVRVTAPLPDRPCTGSFGTAMAWWRELPLPNGQYRLLFGGGRRRDEPDSLFPQFQGDAPHPHLEAGGFSPSEAHQRRLDEQFALLFPHYAHVPVTHRWGGLQSFTADHLPLIGCLDEEQRIYGMVGFNGRGNCHSDVGAEYLAGKLAGVRSPTEERYGYLFKTLMSPERASADWGLWQSAYSASASEA